MSEIEQIRKKTDRSKTAAAALASVAPLTWRLFETDPNAVGVEKRRACELAVEQMRREIEAAA
jgi:hypothetical protein